MKTKVQANDNCVIVRLGGKEVGWQNRESTNRKVLGGRVRGVSLHQRTKPCCSTHTVKGPAVRRKFTFLSGEILTLPQGGQEVSPDHAACGGCREHGEGLNNEVREDAGQPGRKRRLRKEEPTPAA